MTVNDTDAKPSGEDENDSESAIDLDEIMADLKEPLNLASN
jgi:hypothetical protein